MQRVLILGFVWVVACGPPPEVCNMGGGTGGFSGAPPFNQDAGFGGAGGNGFLPMTKVGVAGKPMQVILSQPQFATCGAGSKVLEVITEVLDPMNRPVEHTRTAAPGFSTTVTFTPKEPGDYHLSARFEPSIGTQQVDVVVAKDMTATTTTALNTSVPCRALEVMPSGLVLCQTSASLRVYRDGALLQSLESDEFAVSGNVVWSTRIGVVQRQVDLGGALGLGPAVKLNTAIGDTAMKLVATADQLVASGSMGTVRIALQGGMLVETKRMYRYIGQGAGLVTGDLNLLLFWEPQGTSQGRLCRYNLNTSNDLGCQELGRVELLGSDAAGHWSHGDSTLRVDSLGADGKVQSATMAFNGIPFTGVPFTNTHVEASPAIATTEGFHLVPRLTATGIILDAYQLPEGFVPKGGTTTALRAEHPDGRQLLFAR